MASRDVAMRYLDLLEECELLIREPAARSEKRTLLEKLGDRVARKRRTLESTWSDQLQLRDPGEPKPPGARHLAAALEAVVTDRFAGRRFVKLLEALGDRLYWSSFYHRDLWSEEFIDEIGALHILGPDAPVRSVDMKLGLFLMGPEVYYPLHAHPAEELYLVLGGDISFRRGPEEAWRPVEAGRWRYHESNEPHEMRAGARPPLTLYLWTGDIFQPSWYKADPDSPEEPPKYPTM